VEGLCPEGVNLKHAGNSYNGSCGRWEQVWRGYSVEGYYDTRWPTGLWSTQAKVEGIVLKAAWNGGRNSIVVNDPLGEPGGTPLYEGRLISNTHSEIFCRRSKVATRAQCVLVATSLLHSGANFHSFLYTSSKTVRVNIGVVLWRYVNEIEATCGDSIFKC